jgi:hypothetical protein
MMMDTKDLKRLQWAIAFLIIMSLVGGGAVWTTEQMRKSSNQTLLEATAARKEIQAKLARTRDEQQELTEKLNRFQMLRTRGLIGPEKRLDWIEAIARIKTARRIFKLDYEFAPQRSLDASILPGGGAAGSFEFMSSQMRMQIHLLHERELLDFIADLRADLRKTVEALVHVRSCTIERLAPSAAERGSKAQLKAECTLEWITLKERK